MLRMEEIYVHVKCVRKQQACMFIRVCAEDAGVCEDSQRESSWNHETRV